MVTRAKATRDEAEILLKAQGEIIREGHTAIRCPRCGKSLKYTWMESGETTECIDLSCIILTSRGI